MENKELAWLVIFCIVAVIVLSIFMMIFNPVIRDNLFIFIMIIIGTIFLGIVGIRVAYVLLASQKSE